MCIAILVKPKWGWGIVEASIYMDIPWLMVGFNCLLSHKGISYGFDVTTDSVKV